MIIYLLCEEYHNINYGKLETYSIYPYRNKEDIYVRLADESSHTKEEIKEFLQKGNFFSGNFIYHIEEHELL